MKQPKKKLVEIEALKTQETSQVKAGRWVCPGDGCGYGQIWVA